MKALFGSLAAVAIAALACGSGPTHKSCQQTSDCPSGQACHFPEGSGSGYCAETCTSDSSCPAAEPYCQAEVSSGTPMMFCGCVGIGPDAGTPAQGCGAIPGYTCNVQIQLCTSR